MVEVVALGLGGAGGGGCEGGILSPSIQSIFNCCCEQ